MNNAATLYTKRLNGFLTLPKKDKRALLASISERIDEYIEENPSASYTELEEEFGSPQELAKTSIETKDFIELSKNYKKKTGIIKAIAIVGAIIALILIVSAIIKLKMDYDYQNGYYVETIEDYGELSSLPYVDGDPLPFSPNGFSFT